ncbi:4Fe-4S dicluster domain-containing protein [Aporhodopirellula aestuarii]|uniref:4Fe-4S dicluster domain-containing protein n=1 Tax=Aporhodopirellula aestuarii TaxID=2950107 RepID=A0ABT0U5I5_9BACT|nr:4Fe-4S dicluster domain-containing protein [Aporhodopirellula aestuarii]MCM2372192.1 4Fe-4S dicluster domain-containing protein [Aporhodopirellula aestuarii]
MRTGSESDSKGEPNFAKRIWRSCVRFLNCCSPVRFLCGTHHQENRKRKSGLSRRDLFHGRLWKSARPTQFEPLVTRYPKPVVDETPVSKPRSISGINIDPVPPTNLGVTLRSKPVPVFRPPGAIDEAQFLVGCTRCGDCITVCPYDAIRTATERYGSVAGTPVIEADTQACMMCEDFPCITACKPGVLVDSIPKVMGTARVTEHLCLAHHHTTCTVCSERCPVEGAITVRDGKPTVIEDICTGCGVCRYVCPAPENAILLMPAFSRPGI